MVAEFHENVLAPPPILAVEIDDRMPGSARAGEEIEHHVIGVRRRSPQQFFIQDTE